MEPRTGLRLNASSKPDCRDVREVVLAMVEGIDVAAATAPAPGASQAQVDADEIIDLAERPGQQYRQAEGETSGGSGWLDACGVNTAAQAYHCGDPADLTQAVRCRRAAVRSSGAAGGGAGRFAGYNLSIDLPQL